MSDKTKQPGAYGVTADDVAAAAGVSRWTVNRAFKKDASISAKARQKVLAAAEELGYVPDLLAASLASDRSNLVALLVDDFTNPHKLVMIERVTRILRQHGWGTLLVNMLGERDASTALLNASQRRVDAAILIGIQFNDAALAPRFLAGPDTESAHLRRKETFLAQWQEKRGLEPEAISVPAYDSAQAFEAISAALSGRDRADLPDIIVCENDALAMGAIDAIRYRLGLRVPEDIAVTGVDDIPQAASAAYDLTTYRQPITQMAEALVQVLEGKGERPDLCGFQGHMVERGSA
ncbi:MAG: substrate-binding domain-containing protein [Maritimibacter sp.]